MTKKTMKTVFEQIIALLDEGKYEYEIQEHEAVRTSEEAARIRGVSQHAGAKAMVAKTKEQYILFVLPADWRVDWKQVKAIIGEKDIRLASIEEAEEITRVQMGSVPPFGNVLQLDTYMDPGVLENEYIYFNPGSKTHSIKMKSADLLIIVSPKTISFASNNKRKLR